MGASTTVIVEFYGIPRQRAGRAELAVPAGTVGEVLAAVVRSCPALTGVIGDGGRIAGHYLVSIDGQRFVREVDEPVPAGQRLLVLSAEAGG